MKTISKIFALLLVLGASAFTVFQSSNWKVKEEAYSVSFKGPKVEGIIKGLKASISFDPAKPENAKISASMDANSLNTGNGMMNKHAKSDEALDVEKFPTITFESTSISGKNGSYSAKGKLSMKGITKEMDLPFTFENANGEGIIKGKFNVVSKDFNITRKGAPESFEITLVIPVTNK